MLNLSFKKHNLLYKGGSIWFFFCGYFVYTYLHSIICIHKDIFITFKVFIYYVNKRRIKNINLRSLAGIRKLLRINLSSMYI